MKIMIKYLLVFITLTIGSQVQADDSQFAQLFLPKGVSMMVPKNWWVLTENSNESIATMAEASLHLAGIEIPPNKETVLFRANTKPGTSYAAVSVTATDAEFTSEDLSAASKEELNELTISIKESMLKVLAQSNQIFQSFDPLEVVEINGHTALKMSFCRTGLKGDVKVVLLRIPIKDKEIAVHTSYWVSGEGLLKPVTDYMRTTIKIN